MNQLPRWNPPCGQDPAVHAFILPRRWLVLMITHGVMEEVLFTKLFTFIRTDVIGHGIYFSLWNTKSLLFTHQVFAILVKNSKVAPLVHAEFTYFRWTGCRPSSQVVITRYFILLVILKEQKLSSYSHFALALIGNLEIRSFFRILLHSKFNDWLAESFRFERLSKISWLWIYNFIVWQYIFSNLHKPFAYFLLGK